MLCAKAKTNKKNKINSITEFPPTCAQFLKSEEEKPTASHVKPSTASVVLVSHLPGISHVLIGALMMIHEKHPCNHSHKFSRPARARWCAFVRAKLNHQSLKVLNPLSIWTRIATQSRSSDDICTSVVNM